MTTLAEIIPVLVEKTQERKLAWEKLSGTTYIARLGDNALEITWGKDGHATLFLRNENGDAIEREHWTTLPSGIDQMLDNLFIVAQRRALRTDETLDDIKRKLDSL